MDRNNPGTASQLFTSGLLRPIPFAPPPIVSIVLYPTSFAVELVKVTFHRFPWRQSRAKPITLYSLWNERKDGTHRMAASAAEAGGLWIRKTSVGKPPADDRANDFAHK